MKKQASKAVFTSAATIAEDIIRRRLQIGIPCPALPSVQNIARAANRHRQHQRPRHPTDLDFELQEDHVGERFVRADVRVKNNRHIILATDAQLDLLVRAKTWYIDGTFKVVREPFVQLASIHAFIKKDGIVKQEPLCFMYMSSRKRRDYVAVLRKVLEMLPGPPAVIGVVSDFERALWKAVSQVLVWAKHRGCSFHWGQSVWRKIQEKGLAKSYTDQNGVYRYCRKLLGLPYLPAASITSVFQQLEGQANTTQLQELVAYINNTWITTNLWPPAAWSVYGQPIRTNNDVEGWHHRLNRKANNNGLNMYLLFSLLKQEAEMVEIDAQLMSDNKVRRNQRKATCNMQSKINGYWREYEDGTRTISRLLSACARLYAPHQ